MHDVREIEDNLRTIRRLMERGRRYEAITGRGALLAGSAALVVAFLVNRLGGRAPSWWTLDAPAAFLIAWPLLALLSAGWLARAALRLPASPDDDATRRLSASARAVGRAVLPAYVLALALTIGSLREPRLELLAGAWIALHGIAILATSYHAPRRLVVLGGIFLAAGAWMPCAYGLGAPAPSPNAALALAFGGLHLGYGLFSVLRPLPAED